MAGLVADAEVCLAYAEGSPSIVTPLNRYLGYDEAASIAKEALAKQVSIREVVIARGHVDRGKLTENQLDEALDLLRMTHPDPADPLPARIRQIRCYSEGPGKLPQWSVASQEVHRADEGVMELTDSDDPIGLVPTFDPYAWRVFVAVRQR